MSPSDLLRFVKPILDQKRREEKLRNGGNDSNDDEVGEEIVKPVEIRRWEPSKLVIQFCIQYHTNKYERIKETPFA